MSTKILPESPTVGNPDQAGSGKQVYTPSGCKRTVEEYRKELAAIAEREALATPEGEEALLQYGAAEWQEQQRQDYGPGDYFRVRFGPERKLQHPDNPAWSGWLLLRAGDPERPGVPMYFIREGGQTLIARQLVEGAALAGVSVAQFIEL